VQPHAGHAFPLPANFTLKPRGSGQPLPEPVQKKMEGYFNTNFADVRVHVGPEAPSIGALAFTHGTDLYFAPGQYNPQSTPGQQLLGHELTHVLQQRAGRVRNPLGSGMAVVQDPTLEAEADRLGHHAAAHLVHAQAKMAPGSMRFSSPVRISAPMSAGPGSYLLVAGTGGRQVGSVMVHAKDRASIEVTDLGVDQAHREHGIGKMLIASAARTGQQFGKSKVTLAAQEEGSGRLTEWYKGMGFAQVGVNRRGYPRLEAPISRVLGRVAQQQEMPYSSADPTLPMAVVQRMKRKLEGLSGDSGSREKRNPSQTWPGVQGIHLEDFIKLLWGYLGPPSHGLLTDIPDTKEALKIYAALRRTCKALKEKLDKIVDLVSRVIEPESTGSKLLLDLENKSDLAFFGKTRKHRLLELAYGIHDTARVLVQNYPPQEYVYISLGNSPTPVTLYIRRFYPGCIMTHIPLSALTPCSMKQCKEYIFKFLRLLPKDRPWLVLDISTTSAALVSIQWVIEQMDDRSEKGVTYVAINQSYNPKEEPEFTDIDKGVLNALGEEGINLEAIGKIGKLPGFSQYQVSLSVALEDAFLKSDPYGLRLYETLYAHETVAIELQRLLIKKREVHHIARLLRFLAAVEKLNEAKARGSLTAPWVYDRYELTYY